MKPCKNCRRTGYVIVYLPRGMHLLRCRCGYETRPWATIAQAKEEWNGTEVLSDIQNETLP